MGSPAVTADEYRSGPADGGLNHACGVRRDMEECARIERQYPGWMAWVNLDSEWLARRTGDLRLRVVRGWTADALRGAIAAETDSPV